MRLARFSQPLHRVPEHVPPVHVLCVNTGVSTRLESTIAGRCTVGRSESGDIALYPAGLPQSFRWYGPAEFLQIHHEPGHLDRIAAELTGEAAATLAPSELCDDELLAQLVRSIEVPRSNGPDERDARRYMSDVRHSTSSVVLARYFGTKVCE